MVSSKFIWCQLFKERLKEVILETSVYFRAVQNKTSSYILLFIFFVSVTVRFFFCTNGGQFFYVDEARFMNGHYLLAHISDGDWTSAFKRITTTYAHTLFIFISAIVEGFRFLYILVFIDSSAPAFLLADSRILLK